MTSYNAVELFDEIERVVKSTLSVSEGLRRVIQFCERARPHEEWSALRALDVDGDLPRLHEWRDADQRVLCVGFDSGDFICIGALRKEGLVFSRNSEIMD